MWNTYYTPSNLDEALDLLARHGEDARVIAGGTDLLLEIERGLRRPHVLIDITRIRGLDCLDEVDGRVHIGPLVTHGQAQISATLLERAYPLARACSEVGAPQIRNRGTIAGNLITASPANDAIPPLWALDATVRLRSATGERVVAFPDFYRGVRRTALEPGEMLVDISFPAMQVHERGAFIKLGLRKSQAISVINVAAILGFDAGTVVSARLAFGSVAPTIVRAPEAEAYLVGRRLDERSIADAACLAAEAMRPIDDVRSPAGYRKEMVRTLTARSLRQLRDRSQQADRPERPPALRTPGPAHRPDGSLSVHSRGGDDPILLKVNGREHAVRRAHDKTLLRVLRDDLRLTGSKEGCGEGECGACTVYLDGAAVMACLVPAPAAHGREVVTIEGLAGAGGLHPVQQAFIDADAVQCGYCSPGFIMAGAKLLEEYAKPTRAQVEQALSGNLCRCTGYVNIVRAIEIAAERRAGREE